MDEYGNGVGIILKGVRKHILELKRVSDISACKNVKYGVPHGSVIGPLLF